MNDRSGIWLGLAGAVVLWGPVFAQEPAARAGVAQAVVVDIQAQPLKEALRQFGSQTGVQVMYRSEDVETAGVMAPHVAGRLTAREALERLLSGSRFKYEFVNSNTVRILGEEEDVKVGVGALEEAGVMRVAQGTTGDGASRAVENVSNPSHADHTAQESAEGPQLEEVVVTAQKRAERLQDVPVPVTALSAESLVSSNQLRLQDYYTKIPGLNLVTNADGGPMIAMRGIATGGQTASTVGIVVDDVPYGGSTNTGTSARPPDIDPNDLVRVEALRGPQGTLYGASSIGGLLKFVTVDPSIDSFSAAVQAGAESVTKGEAGYSLRGSINVPLSETLAIRASGFTTRQPGYVDNIQTGANDVNRRESEGGRLSMLWRPTDDFTLKLGAVIQDSNRLGPAEIDSAQAEELAVGALQNTALYGRKTQVYSANMTGQLGNVELTSVSGFSVDRMSNRADISFGFVGGLAATYFGVTGIAAPFAQENEKFTQELRASIPLGERINWLVGAFYSDEEMATRVTYLASDFATAAVAGTLLDAIQPSTFEELAAFTNFTFDVTERFDVQLGGRASENRQAFSSVRTGPGAVNFYGANPSIIAEQRFKDSPFTYLLTPRLRISPDLMIYLRVASGYRAGGPNANCSAVIPCQFDADTTEEYELGFKGNVLDRMLSFDAAVYYIDWKDVQINIRDPIFNVIYTANAGRAKSQGIELSLESRPLTGLTLSATSSWNQAKLTKDFPASNVSGLSGDRLPYSSPFSGSFSVVQEFPLGSIATGFVGGSASYVGSRKGLFRATTQVRGTFPSYTQIDLQVGARRDGWSINAYANNLTDERGILNSGLDANRLTFVTYIQPRTVGLTLGYKF
jgi:iron complex outermembrane recepter protein